MVIARAPERFSKEEFDTMIISILKSDPLTQRAPQIMKLISCDGSRGGPGSYHPLNRSLKLLLLLNRSTDRSIPFYEPTNLHAYEFISLDKGAFTLRPISS